MRELSLNVMDIAQNSLSAGASLTQIVVEESSAEDTLTLKIIDNGRGMTAEQAARVTDPFFTTRTTQMCIRDSAGGDLIQHFQQALGAHAAGSTLTAGFVNSELQEELGDIHHTDVYKRQRSYRCP